MDEISPASPLERLFAVAVGGLIFVIALAGGGHRRGGGRVFGKLDARNEMVWGEM